MLQMGDFGLQLFRVDGSLLYLVVYASENAMLEDVGVVVQHQS